VQGVVEIFNGIVVSGPAVTFHVDAQRAATFGVTTADVTSTVEAALGGTAASTILERGRAITVRVTLPGDYRNPLDALRALRTHGVRLDQVATIEYEPGQTEIHRDGLRQSLALTARLDDLDLGPANSRTLAQPAPE